VYSDPTIKPSPSPPNAGRYTFASRLWCQPCGCGIHCPRASDGLLPPPPFLVGYVRWDARSNQVHLLVSDNRFQQLYSSHPFLYADSVPIAHGGGFRNLRPFTVKEPISIFGSLDVTTLHESLHVLALPPTLAPYRLMLAVALRSCDCQRQPFGCGIRCQRALDGSLPSRPTS
jgi:hypothetical protein